MRTTIVLFVVVTCGVMARGVVANRRVIDLNGTWQAAEGG